LAIDGRALGREYGDQIISLANVPTVRAGGRGVGGAGLGCRLAVAASQDVSGSGIEDEGADRGGEGDQGE
jgi:hypothetical protein